MKGKLVKAFLLTSAFVFFTIAALFMVIYSQVSKEAATRIERGAIEKITFSESPIYYDDGVNLLGVFFDQTHRKYIHYKEIPETFIEALIAAEDRHFFNHYGFDIRAIIRASIANYRAGKTVQGGSTITQQLAKNIFERKKKSYKAKLMELMQSVLLERRYKKEEILEMYTNQFFVTGFGRGLSIAAQYFFAKEVGDLDLVESAFIAGSIKGPNRYNPFTKKTEADKKEAVRLAKHRKDYVLSKMLEIKFITKEKYTKSQAREVPFKEGKITYKLNVILDYIRGQLQSDYFRAGLQDQGIENIATSGIKIYTSINKEVQENALRSIRKHLTLLDVKLSGLNQDPSETDNREQDIPIMREPRSDSPSLCQITQVNRDRENPFLTVRWNDGEDLIDYEGLKPIAEAWLKGKAGNWAVLDNRYMGEFLKNYQIGDMVPVQFMEPNRRNDKKGLMLLKIPSLQGGIVVLKNGMVKAMVGGFFNEHFNRAFDAKRQLGSIFKPIVYTAALQLKWNSLDPLINMRDIFRFENTLYFPKPDHEPASNFVSMAWAGVKSENLASVWLLYHLTDHLNTSEFRQVVDLLGLGRRPDESYESYAERIRDKYGILIDDEAIKGAAFEESKKEVEADIIFNRQEDILTKINRLQFHIDNEDLNLLIDHPIETSHLSFKRLLSLNQEMKIKFEKLRKLLEQYSDKNDPGVQEIIMGALTDFYIHENENMEPRLVYSQSLLSQRHPHLRPLQVEWVTHSPTQLDRGKIWIDNFLPSLFLDSLQQHMEKHYKRLLTFRRYDPELLFKIHDFRILVNLLYVTFLSKEIGIFTPIDPVLSFPLGANSISIMEAALAYQAIMSGNIYPFPETSLSPMIPIITKIEDRKGEIIWEYQPHPKKIISGRVSGLVSGILNLVMEKGTGQSARNAIRLAVEIDNQKVDIPISSFGKTGTANRLTNSSFVGFIPGPNEESRSLDIRDGYVIASYVGYDDNRPMKAKHISIYGASGALPIWIDTANAIANSHDYKKDLQLADLVFGTPLSTMWNTIGLQSVPISPLEGLPVGWDEERGSSKKGFSILADLETKEGTLRLNRLFEPLKP
ncbi:MAG: transglycosylase domain-containing protein [Pseudomonadota bacterium]